MENLMASLNAVYPLLTMLAVGMLIRRAGLVSDAGIKEMNALIYKVFFPFLLYANVMDSDFSAGFNWKLVGFAVGMTVAAFLLLMALVPRLEKENAKRGVLVQGIFRSNFLVFGISIVTTLYGTERLAPTVLLAAFTVPLMNALSVVALETFRSGKPNARQILLSVMRNPIILGTLLAFVLRALHVDPLPSATRSIAKVGTPFALVVIGASFKVSNVRRYRKPLFWGVLSKLVFLPAAAVTLVVLLGFRNELLIALMAVFGGPCATASYAMAQQMGGDGDLAALMVVFTSMLCVVTFFGWIFLLKTLCLA